MEQRKQDELRQVHSPNSQGVKEGKSAGQVGRSIQIVNSSTQGSQHSIVNI